MPLFGPKPNKTFVFIHYKTDPPTSSQQAEIMASLAKGKTPVVFAEAVPMTPEVADAKNVPAELYEKLVMAYVRLVCSKYLMKNRIGMISKSIEHKTYQLAGFLVSTSTGQFTEGM